MNKKVSFSVFLTLIIITGTVSAEAPNRLSCTLSESCSQTSIVWLSAETNAHGDTTGVYPYVLCCGDSQGGAIAGLGKECSGTDFYANAMKLSSSTNAHAQTSGTYPQQVCLSVDGNPAVTDVDCMSVTGESCPSDYKNILRLSAETNAHLSGTVSSYPVRICCRVGLDDTPPTGVSVIYPNGFTNSKFSVTVDAGEDLETDIDSTQLYAKTANLDGSGGCIGWTDWTAMGSQTPSTTSVDVDIGASGTQEGKCYMFKYSSTNGAQLTAEASSSSITRADNVKPVSDDNFEPGTYGGTVDVQITCSDEHGSGCSNTVYCIKDEGSSCTPGASVPQNGIVEVECASGTCNKVIVYYSIDNTGNTESWKETETIYINRDLPWCRFTAPDPEAGQYTKDSVITLEWEGEDPGGATITGYEIMYRVDGGDFSSLTNGMVQYTEYEANLESNHQYDFRCIVTNEDDETGQSGILSLFVDSVAPSSEITTPEWSGQETVNIQWTGDDFGGSGISMFFVEKKSGTAWNLWHNESTEGSKEYVFGSGENSATFRVYAKDKATNGGTPSPAEGKTVRLDMTKPVCTLNSLYAFQKYETFPVSWTGTDSWEGSGSTTELGGKLYYTLEYSTNSAGPWTKVQGVDGAEVTTKSFTGENTVTYYFRCYAKDSAGNTGDPSGMESTTVDSSPPEVEALGYNQSVAEGEQNNVTLKIKDLSGLQSVVLTVDGNDLTPTSEVKGDEEWDLSWSVISSGIGTKTATITATDMNGNVLETTFDFSIAACIDGQTRECHPSSGGVTYDQGMCRASATRTCVNGLWTECTGGTFPATEDCNGEDDDCDGVTDRDPNGDILIRSCGTDSGICVAGTQTCGVTGWLEECVGEVTPDPEGEKCGNKLDDDCDGSVDEDCVCEEGETQPCGFSNVGECQLGEQTCENGKMGECMGSIEPINEVCGNGLDDDCDGQTDEGCGTGTDTCFNGYLDDDEEGVDCGGPCTPCAEPFPIGNILMLAGIIIMAVLMVVWYMFRRKGEEVTWEGLKSKWGA